MGTRSTAMVVVAMGCAVSVARASEGTTRSATRVLSLIEALRREVKETRYQGRTVVRRKQGYFAWDCSGMTQWILVRAAPRAARALGKSRAVARDFFHLIDRAPENRWSRGWTKLGHVSEARPGDLFAWLRSPLSTRKITGHVGFLMEAPRRLPGAPNVWLARVLDATSLPHQDDTRDPASAGGFGFGTIAFITDESGETVGYGWYGSDSPGMIPTRVVFGRVGP